MDEGEPLPVTPMTTRRRPSRSPGRPGQPRSASRSPGNQRKTSRSKSKSPHQGGAPKEVILVPAADVSSSAQPEKKVSFGGKEVAEYKAKDPVEQLKLARALKKDALKRKGKDRQLPADQTPPENEIEKQDRSQRPSSRARKKADRQKGGGKGGKGKSRGKGGKGKSRGRQGGSTRSVQLQQE
jgi:hypothetical protein